GALPGECRGQPYRPAWRESRAIPYGIRAHRQHAFDAVVMIFCAFSRGGTAAPSCLRNYLCKSDVVEAGQRATAHGAIALSVNALRLIRARQQSQADDAIGGCFPPMARYSVTSRAAGCSLLLARDDRAAARRERRLDGPGPHWKTTREMTAMNLQS